MIPEYLKDKHIKFQQENISVFEGDWFRVKRNYYCMHVLIEEIAHDDLVVVDLCGAKVKRVIVQDGEVVLYANSRLESFNINIYVLDDPKLKVGVSTEDKHFMADPKKE